MSSGYPFDSFSIKLAEALDSHDELRHFRERFYLPEPGMIYLDGNSLGRLPRQAKALLAETVEHEWGERLIRSWNESWINLPRTLGDKIARLIGAQPGEVLVADSTSINLFKLAAAALKAQPDRRKIISDVLNFPSDLYILEGLVEWLDNRHSLKLIEAQDEITVDLDALQTEIDDQTALLALTHVAFKSAYLYDMEEITRWAHQAGAMVLWDLCHSVGAVPLDMAAWGVDLAVGCTYKYLNGGPGAPAFLYVRHDLQEKLIQPLWGWFAAKNPFEFELNFSPSDDISRFRSGTIPILALRAIEPGLDLMLEAGIERLRRKSIQQTEYLIFLANEWLLPSGFSLGSPTQAKQRGSHVSLRHAEAYRINRAMIEASPPALRVIPDFRAPDNIRLGIAPIYTSFVEIHQALWRIKEIVDGEEYLKFPQQRLAVT